MENTLPRMVIRSCGKNKENLRNESINRGFTKLYKEEITDAAREKRDLKKA